MPFPGSMAFLFWLNTHFALLCGNLLRVVSVESSLGRLLSWILVDRPKPTGGLKGLRMCAARSSLLTNGPFHVQQKPWGSKSVPLKDGSLPPRNSGPCGAHSCPLFFKIKSKMHFFGKKNEPVYFFISLQQLGLFHTCWFLN